MRRATAVLSTAVLAASAAVAAIGTGATSGAAAPAFTVRTLHFAVHVGPKNATTCDVIGDLYTPRGASRTHRVPAILTTNGFGGSKDDQKGIGQAFARRGYEVLSYSGLGFGGSGCKITLDDPQWDGKAGSQLISFLGGRPGIAFTDAAHTHKVAPLRVVRHDRVDHAGRHDRYDPRVGTIGGSYGGGNQFAIASIDPRLDTIVPLITWNDLTYSLDPNNTDQVRGVSTANPGAIKLTWGLLFSADGAADGLSGGQQDPSRLYGCPNFPTFVCTALATGGTTGYFQPDALGEVPARLGRALHEAHPHPHAADPGRERHPVQPQRGRRDLPGAARAAHARHDDLAVVGALAVDPGARRAEPRQAEPAGRSTRPGGSPHGSTTTCAGTGTRPPGHGSPTSATGSTTRASRRRPTRAPITSRSAGRRSTPCRARRRCARAGTARSSPVRRPSSRPPAGRRPR